MLKKNKAAEEENAAGEALTKLDRRRYDHLKDALAAGTVAERTALAQAFHRAMTGKDRDKYGRLAPTEKARWRLDWAQACLTRMVRSRRDVMTQLSETVGTFLPLGAIVQQEGGYEHEENIRAALCYVRKAIQLHRTGTADRTWARYNEMTQRAGIPLREGQPSGDGGVSL